jgi:hypothetical protein
MTKRIQKKKRKIIITEDESNNESINENANTNDTSTISRPKTKTQKETYRDQYFGLAGYSLGRNPRMPLQKGV